MTLREFFWENFAGDLEYHPRRAVLYLGFAAVALCYWIFAPAEIKFAAIPLVFVLGSLTLILKGIFPLRKSSERIGLTSSDFDELSIPANRKRLPSLPAKLPRFCKISERAHSCSGPFSMLARTLTAPGIIRHALLYF